MISKVIAGEFANQAVVIKSQKTEEKKVTSEGVDTRLKSFISELRKGSDAADINTKHIKHNTMSDGTVNFMYGTCQIGRVYFGKKVDRMQIIDNESVEWVRNRPFGEYIANIPKWIAYMKELDKVDGLI